MYNCLERYRNQRRGPDLQVGPPWSTIKMICVEDAMLPRFLSDDLTRFARSEKIDVIAMNWKQVPSNE